MGAKKSVSVRILKMEDATDLSHFSSGKSWFKAVWDGTRCPQDQLDGFRHVRCRFWQSDRHSIILSKGEETCRTNMELWNLQETSTRMFMTHPIHRCHFCWISSLKAILVEVLGMPTMLQCLHWMNNTELGNKITCEVGMNRGSLSR